jgi:Fe-S-cluster-containing dehydrogenase component
MAKYNFLFDVDRCLFCHACEIACMQENQLPSRPWTRVVQVGPRLKGDMLLLDFLQQRCVQCEDPLCIKACPVKGAIEKNEDGIVLLNHARCILCQGCVNVCPYGALEYNPDKGIIGKCNFCLERLEEGRNPSCVHTCMGRALEVLTQEELQLRIAGKKTKRAGLVTYLFNTISRECDYPQGQA